MLYGGLILVYLVLAGPGLYFFLKKTGKRQYLWGAIWCLLGRLCYADQSVWPEHEAQGPGADVCKRNLAVDTYQKDYIKFSVHRRRTMLPMSCIWIRPTIW